MLSIRQKSAAAFPFRFSEALLLPPNDTTPDLDWRGFVFAVLYLVAGEGFGQELTAANIRAKV
jgi:hypothetical protein